MSKGIGPFWHEKYWLLNAVIFIGLLSILVIIFPNLMNKSPSHRIIYWILLILITLILFGFKFWLIWFIENREGREKHTEKMKLITDPIVKLIENHDSEKAGIEIARITIDMCNKIKNKTLTPKEGNMFYFLLYEDIDMNNRFLNKVIKDLIVSGCTLHDYGTEFGPDLDLMEHAARNYLKDKDITSS